MDNQTLEYYGANAADFYDGTVNVDMSSLYIHFEAYLKPDMHIMDLGCGSGRDSKYFLSKGYKVTAVDGSRELCQLASKLIGQEVLHLRFRDLEFHEEFDAVWACASLIHVKKSHMTEVLARVLQSIKPNGILYMSYKYGDKQRIKDNRLFSDYTEQGLVSLFSGFNDIAVKDWWMSGDARENRDDEKWLNVVVEKER